MLSITKNTLINKNLDDIDIAVFLALYKIHSGYVSAEMIHYTMYENRAVYSGDVVRIDNSVVKLMNFGIIKAHKYMGGYILQPDPFTYSTQFVSITFEEFRAILTSGKRKRFSLLRYFCSMMATIKWKVGHMSIRYIAGLSGISHQTAIRYNYALEQLHIIYVSRNDERSQNTYYGRHSDSKQIEEASFDLDKTY